MLEIPRKAAWNACHRRLGARGPGGPGAWAGGLGGRPGGLGARGPGRGARGPGGLGAWGAWGHGRGARGPGGGWGRLGGMGGAPGGHGRGAWGATHSHHAVARGGNCTIRATTRRRHAVKQLLMLQNPPPARVAGTTRTRGHDTNRTAQPRYLGAAATTAASPAEPSRAQPWLRRASRGPSLRCPNAPGHGPTTQLVKRVPPPGDNTSG